MNVIRTYTIAMITLMAIVPSMNARRVTQHTEWPQWAEQYQLNGLDVTCGGFQRPKPRSYLIHVASDF